MRVVRVLVVGGLTKPRDGTDRSGPVSLGDLENKIREIGGTAQAMGEAARPAVGGLVALGALAMAAVYLLGRRRGKRRATVLEIRRI